MPTTERNRDISDDVTEPYARPLAPPTPKRQKRISSSFDAHGASAAQNVPRQRRAPPPDLSDEVTQTLTDIRSIFNAAKKYSAQLQKDRKPSD